MKILKSGGFLQIASYSLLCFLQSDFNFFLTRRCLDFFFLQKEHTTIFYKKCFSLLLVVQLSLWFFQKLYAQKCAIYLQKKKKNCESQSHFDIFFLKILGCWAVFQKRRV